MFYVCHSIFDVYSQILRFTVIYKIAKNRINNCIIRKGMTKLSLFLFYDIAFAWRSFSLQYSKPNRSELTTNLIIGKIKFHLALPYSHCTILSNTSEREVRVEGWVGASLMAHHALFTLFNILSNTSERGLRMDDPGGLTVGPANKFTNTQTVDY